jgi:hypothetical protein
VNQLAIRVVTGVEMRTVPKTLIRLLVDNSSEMFLVAMRVSPGFLASIPRAVVTVLQTLLGFELQSLYFLLIAAELHDLG